MPVGLHYSWFIIAWLITLSLTSRFAAMNPAWSAGMVWTLGVTTALLFFVGIVLHELAHATVARLGGVPVRGITLFALGGIAQIEKDAATPAKEFWMAIAGPIASVAIGLACWALATAAGPPDAPDAAGAFSAVFGWLAFINVALALFNLVPGFPLDGGRVLRAIVWAVTRDARRATRVAANVGQFVAYGLIVFGLLQLVVRNDFGGLWIAFIGWFLVQGAQAQYLQSEMSAALRGVRVGDVMARDCAEVDGVQSIRRFVDDHLLRMPGRCFAVTRERQVVGIVTPEDVKRVDRDRWDRTSVLEAMRPLDTVHAVDPDASADLALELMGRNNVNQLPVMSNGHLEGVVTRSYLVHQWQVRRELAA
ncbi:MAG: site-2 protease family protein [Vicinamibacterales bacterium]